MNEQFFETIKCDDYEVFNLNYHKERISNTIGLNINLGEYIYPPNAKLLKCKVIYDDSGILEITFDEYIKKDIGIFKLVYDDNITYNCKSTNRESIEKLLEEKENADEIIIIKDGLVTDTSIANIAILYQNEWLTPKTPLLSGTKSQRLLKDGIIKSKDISIDMLMNATKIATLNAMVDFNIINKYKIIN